MTGTSPFSYRRFEYDTQHYYYLPQWCFPQLEERKPVYLIGTRGSGKTTLLKALNWCERVENKTLRRQLGDDPLCGGYIGTYVKLPSIQLQILDEWLRDYSETQYGMIVSFYLDLIAVELITNALAELMADQRLEISIDAESKCIAACMRAASELTAFAPNESVVGIAAFRSVVRAARRAVEDHAQRKCPIADSIRTFGIDQVGTFGRRIAAQLAGFGTRDRTWYFKVCMDEGECLTALQQRVLNTLVRLSEGPLFLVVSFVGRPHDVTTTLIPHLTLQDADRIIIMLDDMTTHHFRELAEGVCTIRVRECLDDPDAAFNTAAILGPLDINTLLQDVLHRSESRAAAALLQNAVKGSAAEADDPETSEPEAADTPTKVTTPPIYQTYLDERLRLVGSPSGAGKDKRRRDSAEYRKKMVAAYLSICHDLRLRHIPYAFADMVFGVSDNCVRDFLAQLHEIFVACDSDLCTFLKRRVPLETQSRAIRAASENKRDSIPGSGVSTPVQTGYLIKGLAIITASLQCSSADGRHLRSSERGEFILQSRHGADDECASVLSVIVDAADAGFLRVHWASGEISSFRVHASLAPAYGFSYRGAYYLVKIDVSEILKLRDSANDDELQKNAIEAVRRISISDDDLPRLPFVDPDDGI